MSANECKACGPPDGSREELIDRLHLVPSDLFYWSDEDLHHAIISRLRAEVERLVAALNREHDEVAGYRELLKLPISPKATCPTCALVDEARRTIGGEDGA